MKIRSFVAAGILLFGCLIPVLGQRVPRGTAELALDGAKVAVEYGRPSLNGRDMLGRATVGMTWRMGADAATTLTTTGSLQFGDLVVPAGEHVLQARKTGENSWSLVIRNLGEVAMETRQLDENVEQFTIALEGSGKEGTFSMAWGTLKTNVPFQAQ